MSREVVRIYFDNKHQIFYIEKETGTKESLPESFINFKQSHKEILASAFPSLKEDIMSAEVGDSIIETLLEPKIAEYNDGVKKCKVTRWYKVVGDCVTQIKDIDVPSGCDCVGEYGEKLSLDSILSHVRDIKSKKLHSCYVVFECPCCNKKQFQVAKNDWVKCDACCESFKINDDSVIVKKKCDSDDGEKNKSDAIACWIKWKKETQTDMDIEDAYSKGNYPFCFNGIVYRVSYADCLSLHLKLYKSFACDAVFMQTENGIKFTDRYKRYLRSLNDYGIETELFKNLKGVENKINSQEYALLPITKAFYWYIKSFCLKNETTLVWNVLNEIVRYKNRRQFIDDLLTANETRRTQLIHMYQNVASLGLKKGFFNGYSDALIELSHMIYDETGLFVYVTEENKLVNFGEGFIGSLHKFDELIPERNSFLESIKTSSIDFWNQIKGSYDYGDDYESSIDGTYYDRLCFYQYVIQGRKEIRYKGISLPDSKDGFEYIMRIVVDAYLSKDERHERAYQELVELLKNSLIWDNYSWFSGLKEAKVSRVSNEGMENVLTFDSLKELIVHEGGEEPSVKLFLACIDVSSKSIKKIRFWYNNKLATLAEHIKRLVLYGDSKNISNEVYRFYNDADVLKVIECTFDQIHNGGFEAFEKQIQKQFEELSNVIEREESRFEERCRKDEAAEVRGTGSSVSKGASSSCGETKPTSIKTECSTPMPKQNRKKGR